jgi:hypothetical protein
VLPTSACRRGARRELRLSECRWSKAPDPKPCLAHGGRSRLSERCWGRPIPRDHPTGDEGVGAGRHGLAQAKACGRSGGDRSRSEQAEAERQPWRTNGKVASTGLVHQRDAGRRETVGSRAGRAGDRRPVWPRKRWPRCSRWCHEGIVSGRCHAGYNEVVRIEGTNVPRGSVTLQKLFDASSLRSAPKRRRRREASGPGRWSERKRARVKDASGPTRCRERSRATATEA